MDNTTTELLGGFQQVSSLHHLHNNGGGGGGRGWFVRSVITMDTLHNSVSSTLDTI